MPQHFIWASIRRRQEWFRLGKQKGVAFACRSYGISRKTYYKWWNRFDAAQEGSQALRDRSRRPHSHPKTASPLVVRRVLELRRKTSYGPRRLHFYLTQGKNPLSISVFGIYKILDRAGCIQRHARKKKKFQSYAAYIHSPGQKVQIDVKHVPRRPGLPRFYQYQAKDLFTKLRFFRSYDELSAQNTVDFAQRCLRFFPFPIRCFQSDHGVEFTYDFLDTPKIHPLDAFCRRHNIVHKLIPVATPRYNGQVERANRTDMEEFYRRASWNGLASLRQKQFLYLRYSNNHRPHMAIDMLTPLQKLNSVSGFEKAQLNYRCYP